MGRRKDQAQFNMRLSRPLLKRLQNAAKKQDRSLNSEMVHRLEHSFAPAEEAITFLRNTLRGMLDSLGPSELSDLARAPSDAPMSDEEAERGTARSRLLARRHPLETDEQLQANLRATAEGFRRNAKRHEARGAHEKAAEMRELADKMERDAGALTQGPHQPVSDQEPELPIPQPRHRTK